MYIRNPSVFFAKRSLPLHKGRLFVLLFFGVDTVGVGSFGGDTFDSAQFSRQGGDNILRCIHRNADYAYSPFFIGYAHSAYDYFTVFVKPSKDSGSISLA